MSLKMSGIGKGLNPMINQELLNLLKITDTPTVCNAIEVVQGQRGFDQFTRTTPLCSDIDTILVGYAITAKIRASSISEETIEAVKAKRMEYYRMVSQSKKPSLIVIEDQDYPHCVGAFWGEVNTSIHKGFGLDGVVTNGVMRDLNSLEPEFGIIAGSIGPSHRYVHVTEIDIPVSVFGLIVKPGDLIHADRHGAIVIPASTLEALASAIQKLQLTEQLIIGPSRDKDFNWEKFEAAWLAFEKARV